MRENRKYHRRNQNRKLIHSKTDKEVIHMKAKFAVLANSHIVI